MLSRARSPRLSHTSYPVRVPRPAPSSHAAFRPYLAVTPWRFPGASTPRIPGQGTCTPEQDRMHGPHVRSQPRLEAGVERTPYAVACTPLFGRLSRPINAIPPTSAIPDTQPPPLRHVPPTCRIPALIARRISSPDAGGAQSQPNTPPPHPMLLAAADRPTRPLDLRQACAAMSRALPVAHSGNSALTRAANWPMYWRSNTSLRAASRAL